MGFARVATVLAAAALGALTARAAFDWDLGADLRIRQEIMDNVPGFPGGGLLCPSKTSGYINHVRYRPRVWGGISFGDEEVGRYRLFLRLTDEFRQYVHPWKNAYTWPDELVVDNLFFEGKGLFDGRFDFSVGRQDIYNLYGLDHVFIDGTPGDGSRTVYADVVRMTYHFDEKHRLDVFGLYNKDDNVLRWGTDRGNHRVVAGLDPASEPDMDDWGAGAVWGGEATEGLPYQVFVIHKNTHEFTDRFGKEHPWTQRETIGTKWLPRLTEELTAQLEAMGQVGVDGDGATLSGWSSYAGLNWKSSRAGTVKPFGKVGYHFMSGDDDAAEESGGNNAWDPIWARGVNDSELFLYGTHYGAGWWSNMHYAKLTAGLDLGKYHRITGSCGPMFAAAQDGLGGGDGFFKGFLSQIRYDFPLFTNEWRRKLGWGENRERGLEIFGHVLAEFFNPGDYFESEKPAWFVRWQVDFRF